MSQKKKEQERRQQIKDFVNQIPEADYDRAISKFLRVIEDPAPVTAAAVAEAPQAQPPTVAPEPRIKEKKNKSQTPYPAKPRLQKLEYVDLFHSPSEHKVYGALQRECEAYGSNTTRTRVSELVRRTALSDKTVRTALHSLVRKLTIEILDTSKTPYGRLYRVYDQGEVKSRRAEVNMTIDHVTKQVLNRND